MQPQNIVDRSCVPPASYLRTMFGRLYPDIAPWMRAMKRCKLFLQFPLPPGFPRFLLGRRLKPEPFKWNELPFGAESSIDPRSTISWPSPLGWLWWFGCQRGKVRLTMAEFFVKTKAVVEVKD